MEFKITKTTVSDANAYDNQGAHNMIKLMIQKGENLNIKFYTSKDNYACAWIESSKVAGFKYQLNTQNLTWLFNYLTENGNEDFGVNPMEVEPYKGGEEDVQLSIVKKLINNGEKIQWTPLFRERNNNISGIKGYFKGKLFFRFQRSDDFLDYLREHNQTI